MTREERINVLSISEEEKEKFINIFYEYENDKDKRTLDSLGWRLKELIPKSQRLLENRYTSRKEVKCLFVIVGTTLEPLLLSILTIRPTEKLVLIFSHESEMQKKQIINNLRQIHGSSPIISKIFLSIEAIKYIENIKNIKIDDNAKIENTSPEKVFSVINKRIDAYKSEEIGVDITGGKKSMVGGGFLATTVNNYHLFYVDFDEYIDDHPKPGTEFIHILDNPYDIYNVQEEALINSLWERQDFDAVNNIIEKTNKKLTEEKAKDYGLEKEKKRLMQIQIAARCYSEWSKYNYSQAYDLAKKSNFGFFDYYKNRHQDILSVLTNCIGQRKTAYGAIVLALDRWTRGRDALNRDEFDKAALCITQAIECLCAFRIIDLINKGEILASSGRNFDPQLEWFSIRGLIIFLLSDKTTRPIKTKKKIGKDGGIEQAFTWTNNLNKGILSFNLNSIKEILDYRNEIAHFECIDAQTKENNRKRCKEFHSTVKEFISLFITSYKNEDSLAGKCFDCLQAPFTFAEFKDFHNIS
ncbi:MAG: hypothetical protein HGB36_10035 [Chlorobiaceae bacterium]|nr:hypothetical protein [Chlorobiaceae bacterium]